MLKERGKPLLKLIDDIPRCSRVVDKIHHEVENNQKNQQDGKALEESFPYEEKLASNLDFLLAHLLLKCFGALYALIAAKCAEVRYHSTVHTERLMADARHAH